MHNIGPNIRRLRKEAGWNEYLDAYNATGISPNIWSNLETRQFGPRGPGLNIIFEIRAALSDTLHRRVSFDELLADHESAEVAARASRLGRGNAAIQRRSSAPRQPSRSPHTGE